MITGESAFGGSVLSQCMFSPEKLASGFEVCKGFFQQPELEAKLSLFQTFLDQCALGVGVERDKLLSCVNRWEDLHEVLDLAPLGYRLAEFLSSRLKLKVEPRKTSVIVKSKNANERIPWHQDFPYSQSYHVSAWVPLMDVGEQDGPMEFGVGVPLFPKVDFWAPEFEEAKLKKEISLSCVECVPLNCGDVVFHLASTWHASRAFSSLNDTIRVAIVFRFLADPSPFDVTVVPGSFPLEVSYGMDSSQRVLDLLQGSENDPKIAEELLLLNILRDARIKYKGEDSFGRVYRNLWNRLNFKFSSRIPDVPCRLFTEGELKEILETHMSQKKSSYNASAPLAIIVSGLPGSGKSSKSRAMVERLCQVFSSQCVVIDCDIIRAFHRQFQCFINRKIDVPKDLVAWFMDGSNFEQAIFREENGLMRTVLRDRISFCLHTVCSSELNVEFVQHVAKEGFRICFLHFDVSVETACARAELRAYKTGRWTSPEFIKAKHVRLDEMFTKIAHIVLLSGGFVARLDNEQENSDPKVLYSIPKMSSEDHTSDMFWSVSVEDRVKNLTTLLLKPIFDRMSKNVTEDESLDFCLAGGCFKALYVLGSPRDLDLWPLSEDSRARLIKLLKGICDCYIEGVYNDQFVIGGTVVEVAKRVHANLSAVLSGFDIAVSAVGCQVSAKWSAAQRWAVIPEETRVHPLWESSLKKRRVFLIEPMPNEPFLLATAERVLRYGRELGCEFDYEIQFLKGKYESCANKVEKAQNYDKTSKDDSLRDEVRKIFQLQ